jgi:hypothetical protein
LKAEPSAPNVISGRVEFPVELRDRDSGKIERIWQHIRQRFAQADKEEGVETLCEVINDIAAAPSDPSVQSVSICGKNRPDALGRFLDQHLRGIHGHARANRSNQTRDVVLLAHRMLSELCEPTHVGLTPAFYICSEHQARSYCGKSAFFWSGIIGKETDYPEDPRGTQSLRVGLRTLKLRSQKTGDRIQGVD